MWTDTHEGLYSLVQLAKSQVTNSLAVGAADDDQYHLLPLQCFENAGFKWVDHASSPSVALDPFYEQAN